MFDLELKVPLFYVLSFALSLAFIRCHSLKCFVTSRHSFYRSLSLVVPRAVIHCTTCSHFLPLVVICCHSLNKSLSLVVTWCTTRLYFYERSQQAIIVSSKFRNKYLKSRSASDWKSYTKKRHTWVNILKESKKWYFSNINIKNVTDKKKFCKTVKLISQITLITLKI